MTKSSYLYLLLIFGCLFACSRQKKDNLDVGGKVYISNEIDVSAAVRSVTDKVYLSEWVDSITYIPLETRATNLLGGTGANITPEHIFCGNHCFEWDGSYLFSIGKLGQGPGEEPGFGISNPLFVDGHFYTNGMKFIEYDENGVYSGKEKDLFRVNNAKVEGKFANIGGLKRVGSTMIGFDNPEAVYFFNTDFEIVNTYPIMEWPYPYHSTFYEAGNSMSHYKDVIVFYNYLTDTVYHATEETLHPMWILKIDEKEKLVTDFVYNFGDMLRESYNYFENGKLDEAPLCKLSDNRLNVSSVYETENHLFITCNRFLYFGGLRNIPPLDPPVMFSFEKSTGKISGGKKIIDDVGGLDTFFPFWGVFNDKMLSTIWPYELDEFISEKQEKGEKVDSRLLDLMERVEIDDNPIMIVAHLKN